MFILGLMLLHPVETLHLAAPLRELQTKNEHFPAPQNWLVAILLLGAIQTSTIFALVLSQCKAPPTAFMLGVLQEPRSGSADVRLLEQMLLSG